MYWFLSKSKSFQTSGATASFGVGNLACLLHYSRACFYTLKSTNKRYTVYVIRYRVIFYAQCTVLFVSWLHGASQVIWCSHHGPGLRTSAPTPLGHVFFCTWVKISTRTAARSYRSKLHLRSMSKRDRTAHQVCVSLRVLNEVSNTRADQFCVIS